MCIRDSLETVVSNTTEAGIAYTKGDSQFDQVPPNSFPAKLTRVLFERYKAFNGAADKGLTILSCELIDNLSLIHICRMRSSTVFTAARISALGMRTASVAYGYPWATLAVRIPNALIMAAVKMCIRDRLNAL